VAINVMETYWPVILGVGVWFS